MDEPLSPPRRDWPLLLLLLLLALAMRVWQVKTSEVAARDSIAYVRIAWLLEHRDWRTVIPHSPHHPAYPLSILAVSFVVRSVYSGPLPDAMQYSAQIASSVASVLLVVPMFYLGRELFDRRVGFWAALLFQCLPASGCVLADGLSESLFFLFVAMAFWLAVVAFRRRSPWFFAGVGLFSALAYLTRPEGALIVSATGVVLTALQLRSATRRPWGHFAASAMALSVAALLVAGPFMILIRGITTKPTPHMLFRPSTETVPDTSVSKVTVPETTVALQPGVFAVWWKGGHGDRSLADERFWWGFTAPLDALCKSFFYVLWLPTLLAFWIYRARFREVVGSWVLVLVGLQLLPLLYLVAMKMGYLSDRHTLLVMSGGVYWAAAGVLWLGEQLASLLRTPAWAKVFAALLMGLACASSSVRTLEPMHGDRTGYREAGYWLAEHAESDAFIDDPYTWASYYAGRYFMDQLPHVPGTLHRVYVVIEWSSNKHPRLMPISKMDYVFEHGQQIQTWPVRRSHERAEIVLYEVTY